MRKVLSIVGAVVVAALICVFLIFLGWGDTWLGNQVEYVDQKIDDATNYETRKTVEDSCRAMIASYEADKLKPSLARPSGFQPVTRSQASGLQ